MEELQLILKKLDEIQAEQKDMKAEMLAFKEEQQSMKAEMLGFKEEQQSMKADQQSMRVDIQELKAEQRSFRAEVMERFDQTATIDGVAELINDALLPQLEEMQQQHEELRNTMNTRFDELAGTVEYLEVASVKQATDILKLKRLK